MSDTNIASQADNHVLAEQVYDMIMLDIEPELLLANIPLLDAQYAGETPEAHEERMKRYAAAYKKFDGELSKFMSKVNTSVRSTQMQALRDREREDRERDQEKLNSLSSAFG